MTSRTTMSPSNICSWSYYLRAMHASQAHVGVRKHLLPSCSMWKRQHPESFIQPGKSGSIFHPSMAFWRDTASKPRCTIRCSFARASSAYVDRHATYTHLVLLSMTAKYTKVEAKSCGACKCLGNLIPSEKNPGEGPSADQC